MTRPKAWVRQRDWPKPKPIEERFWPKVDKRGPDECWEWQAARDPNGYGRINVNNQAALAHRVSFDLANGPTTPGLVIDHKCRNPPCVNPRHLHEVTQKQNTENLGVARTNTSGVRGVCWNKLRGKWFAYVGHGKNRVYIGYFTDLAEAERAVIAKRNELFTNNLLDRKAA